MNITTCVKQLQQEYDVLSVVDCDLYGDSWIDLYTVLHNLFREEYQTQQRIVLTSTYDYYHKDSNHGILLQSLQLIVNDIDISNFFICFVTTNPNAYKEYQKVYEIFSTDPVHFSITICNGKFVKKDAKNVIPFVKESNLQQHIENIKNLSEYKRKLLFESKTFCVAPWMSMQIQPDDTVRPCRPYRGVVGNLKDSAMLDIWNQQELKQVRSQMLDNQEVTACSYCYEEESLGHESVRTSYNRRFAKHVNKIDDTTADGTCNTFQLAYLDSRFSNLCNMSCRSCGHYASSSWHKPAVELGLIAKDTPVFLKAGKTDNDVIDQLKMHTDTIESVYFAGGEPFIIQEFYDLVKHLDQKGKHHVELVYNTNMMQSGLKEQSIFDTWKNFKNISVGASLDAEGSRAEYLRSGTKWDKIVDFRLQLLEQRPDIFFYINCTCSIINVLHIPDFHKSWVEKGLIDPEQFNVNLLLRPNWMRVDRAPTSLKHEIIKKYKDHIEWLQPLDKLGRATNGYESIIRQVNIDTPFDSAEFWKNVNGLDEYHKTDLLTTFPELADLQTDI